MKKLIRILLIEDDISDQYFFKAAMKAIDNSILFDIANNGKEALDILRNSVMLPSLIFSDINMPIMNGIECLTEISNTQRLKDIPVIFLSTDTEKAEMLHQMGAKAFIKKTNDWYLLRRQIEYIINLDFNEDSHIAAQTFRMVLEE